MRRSQGTAGRRTGIPAPGVAVAWALAGVVAIGLAGCQDAALPGVDPTAGPPTTVPASAPPTDDVPAGAAPIITSAEWNEPSLEVLVSGLVPGTIDADPPCIVTAEQDGRSVERSAPGEPGPSSIDCGRIVFPQDELGPGAWTFVLSFDGRRSEPVEVEVP